MGEPIGIIEKSENIVLAIRRRLDLELNQTHMHTSRLSPHKRELIL